MSSKKPRQKRYRFPQPPRGMQSRTVQPKEYYSVTGSTDINLLPQNQETLVTSWEDIFGVTNQYIGRRPKPLKGNFHRLTWFKYLYIKQRGTVLFTSTYPGRETKLQSGVLNNLTTIANPIDLMDKAYDAAVSRLYDKLRGGLDVSIDTYQWKQSARLAQKIFDVVRYVRTFNVPELFNSFVYFNLKRGRKIPGGLEYTNVLKRDFLRRYARLGGGLWLEYSYGLKPLLSTVFDVMDEFQRSFDPLMKVKGSATLRNVRNLSGVGNLYTFGGIGYTESLNEAYHCKIECDFALSTSNVDMLSRFSTLNPLGFIWENTPFSFCVDWFVNIGGYMRAFESALLSAKQFRGGFLVKSSKFGGHFNCVHASTGVNAGYPYSIECNVNAERYEKTLDRVVLTSAPFPRSPTVKFDFSSLSKALNAASLLGTFLKPGKR